ncbi:hypothetical protein VRU48_08425 [Pedobacter sp. KR3-3]|uniref:DegT/DnrJ/EryC1/StrS aminotransferase family protein n=1 Tax=Pedobacter albus TaxID=3113905 RepID=A0ABU7I6M9_9SPHI|nr:hypothetical protein [Pedobacter sp. KR3-3]MEE1945130.1 hypothetical protein [Pedobacter sp. KR3-3]
MISIGGYFELELQKRKKQLHADSVKLNTGRNALAYILKNQGYTKLYLPYFACDVLLQPLKALQIQYEHYPIDHNLDPIFDFSKIGPNEAFLYINYFGLKGNQLAEIKQRVPNLIADNCQAYFEKPMSGVDTFYSPRKFFGVPDGGYAYCTKNTFAVLEKDISYQRMEHLTKRIDLGAENGYADFRHNEMLLDQAPIRQMSELSDRLMQAVNHAKAGKIRRQNFMHLHEQLKQSNQFPISLGQEAIPLVYPYWPKADGLREHLNKHKIYTAQYWPNVLSWCDSSTIEYQLASNVIPLPIDQRYNKSVCNTITRIIFEYVNNR